MCSVTKPWEELRYATIGDQHYHTIEEEAAQDHGKNCVTHAALSAVELIYSAMILIKGTNKKYKHLVVTHQKIEHN